MLCRILSCRSDKKAIILSSWLIGSISSFLKAISCFDFFCSYLTASPIPFLLFWGRASILLSLLFWLSHSFSMAFNLIFSALSFSALGFFFLVSFSSSATSSFSQFPQALPYLLLYKSTPHFQGQKSNFSSFGGKQIKFTPTEISQNVNFFFLRVYSCDGHCLCGLIKYKYKY